MGDREKYNKRIHELKKSLITLLEKRPQGILKHDLWNEVSKELQSAVSAKYFGVSKMHNLLEAYSDVMCEVSIRGKPYIQLKTKAEGKTEKSYIQSDQISSTNITRCGTNKSTNSGKGLMPTPQAAASVSDFMAPPILRCGTNTSTNSGRGFMPTPQADASPSSFMTPPFLLGVQSQQNPGMLSSDTFLPIQAFPRPPVQAGFSQKVQQVLRDPWSASSFQQEDVEVVSSDDEETVESDEDFPRLDSPRQNKPKDTQSKAKIPLKTLKENVIKVLKTSPNGIKKSEIWRHYVSMFHQQPAAKDYGVARLTNLLSQFSDVIEEFVRDSQPYIRLKLSQPAPLLTNIPWGGGAIVPHPQASNLGNRSLSSSTSSLDSHRGQSTGSRMTGSSNVIDLTVDEGKGSGGKEKKHNLIDLTTEKQGMDFISLDIPMVSQPRLPSQHPVVGMPSGPSPGHSYSDLQQGPSDLYGMNSMVDLNKQVRPVNTKIFERKDITVTQVRFHGRFPSKDQVENVAKDCIEILAEADEHVSLDRIEKLLLQRFHMHSLRDLGYRYVDNISCVNEHNRMMSKVNAYIQAFIKVRSVCTLFELSECLKEFAPEKDSFASLKLGPLQRLPIIYQLFKFPPDYMEIPEITTMDVLEHLRNYMTKFQKWTERLEMEEFMEYLVDEYDAENGYMLGIRLRSLPLCAQVLKKAQRDGGATRRAVTDGFKNEVRKDIEKVFHKFRAGIIQTDSDGNMEVRPHYLKLHPVMAINEIFQKFQLLMSIDPPTGKQARKKHLKFQSAINEFMSLTKEDSFASQLFHLAICISNTILEEAALELLAPPAINDDDKGQGQIQDQRTPPSRDKVIIDLKKYLERCIAHGSLNLTHIDKIEERLLEDYGFPTFAAMGFGRFLQFLIHEAKQILEECGGTNIGSGTGSQEGDSVYKPHHLDVLEFIHQCKQCGTSQPDQIEAALCKQFHVKEAKSLGYGNLKRLLDAAEKPGKHQTKDHSVIYETVLSSAVSTSNKQSTMQIGILGHQTRDAALACLHNCPLLEDLGSWSQWSLVFEPEHGKLREFIQKYGGVRTTQIDGGKKLLTTDVLALEVKPGTLLKLTSQTSPDKFEDALIRQNVTETCGHLMSLVLVNKGIEGTPVALLANHMKSHLFTMHAAVDSVPGAPSSGSCKQDKAVQFVLDCLVKLPVKTCQSLANQIFLNPLGQVVGSTKSKSLLLSTCCSTQERDRLQELGCLLGIAEWTKQIQLKCQLPVSAIEEIPVDDAEEFFAGGDNLSDESDSEDESETSSISSILSDDEDEQVQKNEEQKEESKVKETEEKGDKSIEITPEGAENKAEASKDQKIEGEEKPLEDGEKDEEEMNKDENEAEDEPMTEEEKHHQACVAIVNQIRREEFGIGIELNEDGQRLMLVQQERLGRSLDRLSKDLYSKDTHFVLELVQNADDNSYPDDMNGTDDLPSVKFTMRSDAVLVLNNESGFTERNIRALCDVGRSTKGKHKYGYIGQKGIGFKSVFRVTDKPEIHSNGFSICFDVNSGPMGYILPHWVEEDVWDVGANMWTTKIILPLKSEMQAAHARSLAARFNDIHPSLLLFLHRLRQITIENQVENSIQRMKRVDYGKNLIEITHNEGTDQWLVTKKMLDASKISLQAKSGVDVESTEIALAFPLKPKGQRLMSQVLPPKQPVFAFLPLRSYGFRFIIQGDFDVPSSREDVDKDSPWNQWIRNEIHTLFIEALDVFKNHPDFNSMEAVTSFLQFVPLEDEILDFFRPVSHQILQKLKAKPCVPTHPNSKGMVTWRIPSQTIIARDPLTREVVTPELLQKHLSLFYLHRDVSEALNPTLTQSLGIESLTTEHLLQIGKALITEWNDISEVTIDQLHMTSKWLACVYRSIDEFCDNQDLFDKLKSMKVIPLATRKYVSATESTIFFPIMSEDSAEKRPAYSMKGRDPMSVLHQDLNTIHPALIDTPDNEVNSQVQKLLLKMGVKPLSPYDVINHHIIPTLKSETWQDKTRETLVSYVVYLKEQSEGQNVSINIEELQGYVRLVTNKGLKNPKECAIHFTPLYGNEIDLPRILPGYDWTLLDGVYIQQSNNKMERKRWFDFFTKLGVTKFLAVRLQKVDISSSTLKDTPWAPLAEIWGSISEGSYIEDQSCSELHDLITQNKYLATYQEQMTTLFELLDKEWDDKYSRFQMCRLCDKDGRIVRDNVESSFSIFLRTLSWLPARQTEVVRESNGSVSWTETLTLMQPSCLYRNSSIVQGYLSHTVPYLEAVISQSSSFCDFLHVKNSVIMDEIKKNLINWSSREKPDIPAIFCALPSHIEAVYKYLYDNLSPVQLQELLHNNPIIFVPIATNGVSYNPINAGRFSSQPDVVAGKMLSRNEVWWEDNTDLFNKYRKLLDEYHADIGKKHTLVQLYKQEYQKKLFVDGGRISQEPSMAEYGELLVLMGSDLQLSDRTVLVDAWRLYAKIGQKLSEQEGPNYRTSEMILETNKKALLSLIKKKKIIVTKSKKWVGIDEHPMISDSRELEKIFEEKDGVHIIDLEKSNRVRERNSKTKVLTRESQVNMEDVHKFLDLCNIKKLSECVSVQEITEMFQPVPKIQFYMHQVVPLIQCYLYTLHPDVYQEHVDINMKGKLQNVQFVQVSKLEVKYSLVNRPDVYVIQSEKCLFKEAEFFFHKDHVASLTDINREIAKYFGRKDDRCFRDLRNFLQDVSAALNNPQGDLNEVLRDNNIELNCLLETEELWEVTPPIQPVLPEPEIEEAPEPEPIAELPPLDDQGKTTSSSGGGLKAWPPMSDDRADGMAPKRGERKEEKSSSKVWPPPKAPDYLKSVKELPSQVRVTTDSGDGGAKQQTEDGGTTDGAEGVRPDGDGVVRRVGGGTSRQQSSDDTRVDSSKRKSSEGEGSEKPDSKRSRGPEDSTQGEPGNQNTQGNGDQRQITGESAEHVSGTFDGATGSGQNFRQSGDAYIGPKEGSAEDGEGGQQGHGKDGEDMMRSSGYSKRRREDSENGSSPPHQIPKKSALQLDNPKWNDVSSEYTYEELGFGHSLKVPPNGVELDTASEPIEIGRWGESVVYNFLLQEKENWDHIIDIVWQNEEHEMGYPYDFEVHMATEEGITVTYIEVKSTLSDTKEVFEISYPQIQFAKEQKEYFHIYRVFNAGDSDKVRLVRIDNLSMRIDQKQVRLCMMI